MPEETEYAPPEISGEEPPEPTSAEGQRGGRKPRSAYDALKSERDRAQNRVREVEALAYQNAAQLAQMQQAMRDAQVQAQLSQLPDDERNAALARYQWEQKNAQLQALAQRAAQAEQAHANLSTNQGRQIAVLHFKHKHGLPDTIADQPTESLIYQLGGNTPEEMEAFVTKLASELGGSPKAPARAKTTATRSQYASDGGSSPPNQRLRDLSREDRLTTFNKILRGEVNPRDLLRE